MQRYPNENLSDMHFMSETLLRNACPTAFDLLKGLSYTVHNTDSSKDEFCDILQFPNHAWKHKAIHSCTTFDNDALIFGNFRISN